MDIKYLLLLQNLRESMNGALDGFFGFITKLGESSIVLFMLALVYWCVEKREGILLMLGFFGNRLVNGFVKITACVYRPWIRDARIKPVPSAQADATGYSFPSGHSANATSVWGGLATEKRLPKVIRALFVVLVLLIGFSRNYLGVHTPQDVVVSIVLGVLTLFVAYKIMAMLDKHPGWDVWVLLGGVALSLLLVLYAALKSYPMDYDEAGKLIVDPAKMAADSYKNAGMALGFFLGWFLERRVIKMPDCAGATTRVVRMILGAVVYGLVEDYAAPWLGSVVDGNMGKFVQQFAMVFFILALMPLVFKLTDRLTAKKDAETKKDKE